MPSRLSRDLTDEEIRLCAVARDIKNFRERAAAADQGRWFRSHSQVVSSSKEHRGGVLIALAEGMALKGGWQPDMTKAADNARWIVGADPHSVLRLCDAMEALDPRLKTILDDMKKLIVEVPK